MPSSTTRSRVDSNDDDTDHDDDCMSNVRNNGTMETWNGIADSSTSGKQPPEKRRRSSPDDDDDDGDDLGRKPAARPLVGAAAAPVAGADHPENDSDGERAHNKASRPKPKRIHWEDEKSGIRIRSTLTAWNSELRIYWNTQTSTQSLMKPTAN